MAASNRHSALDAPRSRAWLPGILAVALAARVAAVVVFESLPGMRLADREVMRPAEQPLFPDAAEYLRVAGNIRRGCGLMVDDASRIGRMPGYPVFLAAVQLLFGERLLAVRLAQAVVGTVAVWLAWRLGRSIFDDRTGLLAAGLLAVYPLVVLFAPLVLAETLFIALLLWGALSLRSAFAQGSTWSAAAAGLAFGLATLVRASLLPFVFLAALASVAVQRFAKGAVGRAVLMLAVFAAAMTPWVVRNYSASGGHFVATTLRSYPSLYEALNPEADGAPMLGDINWGWGTAGLSEYEQAQLWKRRAIAWATANPGRVVVLAGRKLVRFWNPVPNAREFRRPLLCVVVGVPYLVVMALAFAGLAGSWRRAEVWLILLLPVVYYCLLHMVFVSSVRYRVPIMPLVVVLSARGLEAAWGRMRRPRSSAA